MGYDDTDPDPAQRYWLVLNSHGTVEGRRPDVTFRMAMHIDYSAHIAGNPDLQDGYMYVWAKMDTVFVPKGSAFPKRELREITVTSSGAKADANTTVTIKGAQATEIPATLLYGAVNR